MDLRLCPSITVLIQITSLALPPVSRQWRQSWYISPRAELEWLDHTLKKTSEERVTCEKVEVPESPGIYCIREEFPQAQETMLPSFISKAVWERRGRSALQVIKERTRHSQGGTGTLQPFVREGERRSVGALAASQASGLISFKQSKRSRVSASRAKRPVSLSELLAESFRTRRGDRRHLQPPAALCSELTSQHCTAAIGSACQELHQPRQWERERERRRRWIEERVRGCRDCEAL